jgi:hypothetical protein
MAKSKAAEKRERSPAVAEVDQEQVPENESQEPVKAEAKKGAKRQKGSDLPDQPVGTRYEESMRPERLTSDGQTFMSWNVAGARHASELSYATLHHTPVAAV